MNLLSTLFVLFVFLFCNSCSNSSTDTTTSSSDSTNTTIENKAPLNITGTYVWLDQQESGGGGYLAVQQQGKDSLKFELDINNGPPNYPSGSATGVIAIQNNVAIFATNEFGGDCKITFTFQENQLMIEQLGGDVYCGFGNGVIANGIYKKDKAEAIFQYEGGL